MTNPDFTARAKELHAKMCDGTEMRPSEYLEDALEAAYREGEAKERERLMGVLQDLSYMNRCSGCTPASDGTADCPGHLFVREELDDLVVALAKKGPR